MKNEMKSIKEQIESRFDEKCGTYTNEYGYVHHIPRYEEIKLFINSEISLARSEVVEEVRKWCEETKQGWIDDMPKGKCINAEMRMFGRCFDCEKNAGKQESLQDLLTFLQNYQDNNKTQ